MAQARSRGEKRGEAAAKSVANSHGRTQPGHMIICRLQEHSGCLFHLSNHYRIQIPTILYDQQVIKRSDFIFKFNSQTLFRFDFILL